ncbi:MAG: PAS domain S-box protein, partial [Chloroflexales bacterium]|nr:PAS domain S-box protein [Chloroflexales bacterium]
MCGIFLKMIEQSRDGIGIAQDGHFKFVNTSFCELLGYTAEEILNIPGSELLSPKDRDRMITQHYRRMEGLRAPGLDTTT